MNDDRSAARAILGLGTPMLVGAIAATMSGVIDIAMIGHYGAADVVAVASASAVFDIFANVVLATVVGHQILSARFAGAEQPGGIRASARATAAFGGVVAALSGLLCALLGGPLTGLVAGAAPHSAHIGAGFLLAISPTLLLLIPFNLGTAVINAYKRPRYSMIAAIVVNLVNLLLDWLLIFGVGPLPRLGAVGSGLATTLSWAVGVVVVAVVVTRLGLVERIRQAAPPPRADFDTSAPRLSWPAIVSMALDYASTAVFFAVVGRVGASALGGGRIAFQVMIVMYGVLGAFSSGGRVLVGRALGARDLTQARALWRAGQRVLLALALPLAVLLVAWPNTVGLLFTSFSQVRHEAGLAIRVVGICLLPMAYTLGNVSTLRALGKTRWDMYGNLLASIAVQAPIGWLCASVLHLGIVGAFVGVAGYWLIRGLAVELLARKAMHAALPGRSRTPATPGRSQTPAAARTAAHPNGSPMESEARR